MFAGTVRNDEHEIIIREIESKLFPENEIKPQGQHSEMMNFEEEMKFLEEWLAKDTSDEDYKGFIDLVQMIQRSRLKCLITMT
jgi:hypothetical protein